MTPEEYLCQIIDIHKEIELLDHGRRRLLSTTLKSTQWQHDKSFSNQTSRPNENVIVKLEEFSEEAEEKQLELINLIGTIAKEIDKIEIRNHRVLLHYRYVYGMSWAVISEQMNYTVRHLRDIHRNALKEFKRVHPDKDWE